MDAVPPLGGGMGGGGMPDVAAIQNALAMQQRQQQVRRTCTVCYSAFLAALAPVLREQIWSRARIEFSVEYHCFKWLLLLSRDASV